jgi:hypothetical protein
MEELFFRTMVGKNNYSSSGNKVVLGVFQQFLAQSVQLKFIFSKEATKIDEIFIGNLTLCSRFCQVLWPS